MSNPEIRQCSENSDNNNPSDSGDRSESYFGHPRQEVEDKPLIQETGRRTISRLLDKLEGEICDFAAWPCGSLKVLLSNP